MPAFAGTNGMWVNLIEKRSRLFLAMTILSSPRQECLGVPHFRPLGIGALGEVHELAKILRCLRPIADRIGGARGTPETAVAVGRQLERGLVFLQRRRMFANLQQQLRQHLAQWI